MGRMVSGEDPDVDAKTEEAATAFRSTGNCATSSTRMNETTQCLTGGYTPPKDEATLQQVQKDVAASSTPTRLTDVPIHRSNARSANDEGAESEAVRMPATGNDVVATREGVSNAEDDGQQRRSIPPLQHENNTSTTYSEQKVAPTAVGEKDAQGNIVEARQAFTLPSRSTSASSVEQNVSSPIPRLLAPDVTVNCHSFSGLNAKGCPIQPLSSTHEQRKPKSCVEDCFLGVDSRPTDGSNCRVPGPEIPGDGRSCGVDDDEGERPFNVIPTHAPTANHYRTAPIHHLKQMPYIRSAFTGICTDSTTSSSRPVTSDETSPVASVRSSIEGEGNVESLFCVKRTSLTYGQENHEQKSTTSSPLGRSRDPSPGRRLSDGASASMEGLASYRASHNSPLGAKRSEAEASGRRLPDCLRRNPVEEQFIASCRGENGGELPVTSRDTLPNVIQREAVKQTSSELAPPRVPLTSTILADRRSVFYKTQMCPHAIRGRCRLDKRCSFAHSKRELRTPPKLDKTKICASVKAGIICPNGDACSFAHSRSELRHTVAFYKTNMCRNWKAGACLHPETCNHAHGMYELLFFRSLAAGSGCRDFRKEEEVRKGLGLVTDNLDAPKGSDTDDWNSRSRKPLANKCSPTTSERGISAEGRRRAYSSSTLDLVTDHHDLLSNLVPLAPSQEHRGKPGFLTPARTEPAYTQQTSCEQLDLPSREEYCTGAVQASARFTNGQTAREKEDYLFSEDADAPRHASSCPVRTSDVLVPSEGGATHANTGTGKRRKKGSNALVGCRNRKDQNMNCTEVLRWKQEQLFAAAECNRWSPATIATNQKQVGCHSAVGCGKERFLQIGRGSSEVGGEMNTGSIASQVDSHQTLWQSTSLQRGNMATRKNGGMKRRDLRKTAERFILKDDSSKLEIMPSPPPPPPTTVVLDDPLGNSAFELYLTGSCPFLSAAAWHTQPTPGQTHMQLLLSQLQQLQRARVERLSGELPRNIQQQHLEGTKGESSKRRLNTGGKLLERDERWCSRLSGPQEAAEARVGSEREESYLQQQFSPSQLVGEGIQNETFPGNRAFIPERDTCNAALRSSANKTLPGMRKPHIGTGSNLTAPYASGVRRLKAPSICRNHLMPAAGVDDVVAMWLGCKASQEKRPSSSCCNASNPEGPTLDVLGITALVAPQRAVESVDFMRECDEERLGRADSLKGGPAACGSLSAAVSLQAPLPAYEELGNFESTSTEVSWSSGGGPGNTGSSSVSPGSAVEIVGVSDGLPALASPQTWVSSRTDVAANFGADWDRRGAVGFPVVSGDESSPEAEAARVFAALGPETVKVEKRTTGLSPFPYPSIDLAQEALTMENHRRQQWYGDFGNDGGSTAEQVAGTLPMAGAAVSQALDWLTVASQADDSWIVHSHAERLPGRADCVVRNSLGHPVPRCSLGMVDASARREAGHALRGEQEWSVGDRSWPPRDITWMTAALSGHKDKSFTSSPITQEDIATLTSTEPHPGFKLAARSPSPREDAESCCLYQVRTESKDSNLTASATCRHHDVVEEKVINGDYVHGDGKVEIPTRYDLVSQASHGSIDSSTASSDSSGGSEPSWDASVGARPFFVESDTTSHTNVYIPPARRNEGAKCAIASEEAKHHTQELHQAEECFEKTYYESFCTASGQEVHRDAFIGGKLGFHHDLTSLRGEDSWPNRFGGMAGQCSGPEELSFFNVEVDEAGSALLAFTRSRAGLDSRPDNRSLGHASGNLWQVTPRSAGSSLRDDEGGQTQVSYSTGVRALAGREKLQRENAQGADRLLSHLWNIESQQTPQLVLGQGCSPVVQNKQDPAQGDPALGLACHQPLRRSAANRYGPSRLRSFYSETERRTSTDACAPTSVDPLTLIEGMMHALALEG